VGGPFLFFFSRSLSGGGRFLLSIFVLLLGMVSVFFFWVFFFCFCLSGFVISLGGVCWRCFHLAFLTLRFHGSFSSAWFLHGLRSANKTPRGAGWHGRGNSQNRSGYMGSGSGNWRRWGGEWWGVAQRPGKQGGRTDVLLWWGVAGGCRPILEV